ncbi:hypothetical protein FB107DRAFT_280593 [Schizophyllum commune]
MGITIEDITDDKSENLASAVHTVRVLSVLLKPGLSEIKRARDDPKKRASGKLADRLALPCKQPFWQFLPRLHQDLRTTARL